LAPIQWEVWLALQNANATGELTSYRQIARTIKATIDGVRKAVRVIEKEGGILSKEIIRTAENQGFRVITNQQAVFRRGTLNEAKAILKRGLSLAHTPDGRGLDLGTDGLRMYVCNIRQTDMERLLRIPPPEWKIREQTLAQIAEVLPTMTAIEFRLSLLYLIEQAATAKEPIRHYNAWVKAAFEKNGGPLVTEREIEARFERQRTKPEVKSVIVEPESRDDGELLRQYLACSQEQRDEIDRIAEEKVGQLLKVVSDDKRAGIIEEARFDAVRQFFHKKG
jgi:hypothetical protein